jgi:hypothetical protein
MIGGSIYYKGIEPQFIKQKKETFKNNSINNYAPIFGKNFGSSIR